MEEVGKYREAIRSTQEAEELLLKGLGTSSLTATNPVLRRVTDEYLSVVVEVRTRPGLVCAVLYLIFFWMKVHICSGSRSHFMHVADHGNHAYGP